MSVGGRRSFSGGLVALCALVAIMLATAAAALAAAPPTPETTAATNVTAGTAVLNGVLNPHSKASVGWAFNYAPSSVTCDGGGQTQQESKGAEVEDEAVHAEVVNLLPGTEYTACLVAYGGESPPEAFGPTIHFTTSAVAPPPFGQVGSGAGQFHSPDGVGVDRATGDVYVADFFNYRVDRFDGSGGFLGAFGWEVDEAAPATELQTCAASCREGSPGVGAGQFGQFGQGGPLGLAVDDDPLSASAGDVYVVDDENFRVQKFGPSGEFLLMFGGGVDETGGGDVCVVHEICRKGTAGTADGQFEWAFRGSYIAVGPGGAVYVGDRARVQVFEPSGAWRENISLAGLSSEGRVTALAVDAAGDVFVVDQGVAGVREFAPNGTEKAQFDAGSNTVQAIALDPAGDLFVGDASGGFHVLKYSPSGRELDSFASHTLVGTLGGMAFSESAGAPGSLYVSDAEQDDIWTLPVPAPGPVIEAGSESAAPVARGAAALAAMVNPEGSETTYTFQYLDEAHFEASGYASASSTPVVSVGSGFEDQAAGAHLTGLLPNEIYHYRIVATNSRGTATGPDRTFETLPVAQVEGPWAENVAGTSVTLAARVDPLGSSTTYRLEWGASIAYGNVFGGNVGEGLEYVPVGGFHLQGLEPDTTYHYRLITTSSEGTVVGPDHAFTTQLAGEELTLPDGRAWELVSPAKKGGALIDPTITSYHTVEAAAGGGAIAYEASDAIGEDPVGKGNVTEVLSARGPGGWRSRDISMPSSLPPEGTAAEGGENQNFSVFSSDLSAGLIEQKAAAVRPLSPEATERTPYLRNNLVCEKQAQGCYTPLVTPGNVEPGVAFGGTAPGQEGSGSEVTVVGATPDLGHVILSSPAPLTAGAVSAETERREPPQNLYEWYDGHLQLVNVLPDGTTRPGARFGYEASGERELVVAHSISDDGQRIVWSFGTLGEGPIELFVRDMARKRTLKLGGSDATYQTMSGNGSRVFYSEKGELYEVNVENGAQADLTASHGAGEANAGVRDAVLGSSEDGSYIYFVATGALASGARSGAYNLYVMHDGTDGWGTTYISTLSKADEHSWYANSGELAEPCSCRGVHHAQVSSRVSSSGRYLVFMSSEPLTGYDNTDAVSGQPDEEVFLYDAVVRRLVCVSCNPTGARPTGVLDGEQAPLVDPERGWSARGESETRGEHWLAGMLPTWQKVLIGQADSAAFYQPRFLSGDGRLFFDSPDSLVPQATNGLMNVYEYEPPGVGSCTSASATYGEASDGCVSLISSGTSSGESSFYDASENGDDVFFITSSRLVPEDVDTAYDVYDAHVCSPEAPCSTAPVTPPPCASGDSCKAAPSPQPAIFGAPASATFDGAGNVIPAAKTSTPRSLVCKRGAVEKRGKCVRKRKPERKRRARRTGNHGRAGR
jgi:hypothetical protein